MSLDGTPQKNQLERMLTLYIDGASRGNPGPSAIGVVIKDENGKVVAKISRYIGEATNNRAEYEALVAGLAEAARLGARKIEIRLDAELVEKQICGEYQVKKFHLKPLYQKTKELLEKFPVFSLKHISRQENIAHALAQQALNKHRNLWVTKSN